MKNILFSTNSGFFASTLVDKLGDEFKVSVVSPDDLYFSINQASKNEIDLLALAGNITFGEKIINKLKETGIKILDGSIVIDSEKLNKLMISSKVCEGETYTKIPLAESYFIYSVSSLFSKLYIEEMFTTVLLSASHYGDDGVEELTSQTISIFNQEDIVAKLFRERLAFNVIPLISKKNSAGYLTGINKEIDTMMNKGLMEKFLFNMQVVLAPTLSSTGIVFKVKTKEKVDINILKNIFKKQEDIFKLYGEESLAPVNSNINDNKIHIASLDVIDNNNFSFYAVADNVWTLFINNFVRCIETIV